MLLNMKQERHTDIIGIELTAALLNTTRGKIEYLMKLGKINPHLLPLCRVKLLVFSIKDQIIIKCWENRKKAK